MTGGNRKLPIVVTFEMEVEDECWPAGKEEKDRLLQSAAAYLDTLVGNINEPSDCYYLLHPTVYWADEYPGGD